MAKININRDGGDTIFYVETAGMATEITYCMQRHIPILCLAQQTQLALAQQVTTNHNT